MGTGNVLQQGATGSTGGDLLLCTFTAGGTRFAVDALQVQEVLRSQPTSEAPLSPPEVPGPINLRGQILGIHQMVIRQDEASLAAGIDRRVGTPAGAR